MAPLDLALTSATRDLPPQSDHRDATVLHIAPLELTADLTSRFLDLGRGQRLLHEAPHCDQPPDHRIRVESEVEVGDVILVCGRPVLSEKVDRVGAVRVLTLLGANVVRKCRGEGLVAGKRLRKRDTHQRAGHESRQVLQR